MYSFFGIKSLKLLRNVQIDPTEFIGEDTSRGPTYGGGLWFIAIRFPNTNQVNSKLADELRKQHPLHRFPRNPPVVRPHHGKGVHGPENGKQLVGQGAVGGHSISEPSQDS